MSDKSILELFNNKDDFYQYLALKEEYNTPSFDFEWEVPTRNQCYEADREKAELYSEMVLLQKILLNDLEKYYSDNSYLIFESFVNEYVKDNLNNN